MKSRTELLRQKELIEEELKKLDERDKFKKPELIPKDFRNTQRIETLCQEIIDNYEEKGYSKDDQYFLYETVMEVYFGNKVWDYINSRSNVFDYMNISK